MPHLILEGLVDFRAATASVETGPRRWGRAVIKTEGWWTRSDGQALLLEGVVVEFSRALHPLALIAPHHGDTGVRLWPHLDLERTEAVQHWLSLIAADLQLAGAGALKKTNIPDEILAGVGLTRPSHH